MRRLAGLLARHGGAIYTDLRGVGIDLDDGPVWPRVLQVIDHLGPDSATHRDRFPDWRGWSVTNAQLALVVDALHAANWQRSDPKKRPSYPAPSWRPEQAEQARTREVRWQARAHQFVNRFGKGGGGRG